ncbi:histidine kinase-, DNA gyrase B-, and HSP90-like ATPase family protein [[Clostridium] bifermentans ATCC 638]|uniref:Histidine kinase-, DNA gyrase B-, and HSP90-like ATPase family protein n=1 Tax=Paraclostridium bifermentans ATCC 638 = DSM 14991 TaxID=1233171 RepID=T4VIP4_PARBF|nr:sensor histidine kinase [Paraclostridium bifermentans]EQK40557.1 histidine kinase-, DNA gyrase B-, and HSP90-like ATPase family protein [[Clostridium] bifermentans ATCC 638] [Paraclostridium bifermentans ATCC 638 = DSM 14991]RIZ58740.1 ATP-binding protein [Paraclostridium bifermentans]UAG18180.1 GHKL domain-containing protein [Paraclostridium bifermentans]
MLDVELMSNIARFARVFVEYLIFIKILNCLEVKKYKKIYIDIIFLLIGALDATIMFNMATQYYGFINNLKWIVFILFAKLNYKVSYFKSLLYYLTYTTANYIISGFIFDISYFIITGGTPYTLITSEHNLTIIFIIENTISMFINMCYISKIKKLRSIDKEKLNIIIIICCIISNFSVALINTLPSVLYMVKIDLYSQVNGFNINTTPKLSFLSSFLLLMIVFKIIKDIKEKSEERLLKEKIDIQYKYYLNLQESQNKVKKLYHDINNHIFCIKNLSSEKEDVNKYINEMSKELNEFKEIHNTGNMILDIILNEKQNICNENNIDLTCDVNFSKCNFIEMTDVCSIFSNILDNAIEACNKTSMDKKYIKIRGTLVKSYYVIRCENSKINKLEIKNSKIITSKKDKFIHGIGLKSVKSSLEKYNGDLEIEDFKNKFLLQIYIPIDENMTVGATKVPVVL